MSTYGSPASPSRGSASASQRERMMSMIGAALGVLMFIWGFLKWLSLGGSDQKQKYAGFAFGMPTTAVIGLSLAAGLLALLGAVDRRSGRGVPSAVPAALAAPSFLVALGILLGKGSISPAVGDKVGVEIGLILGLITALVQTAVFGAVLASRKDDAANTGTPVDQGGYSQTAAYGAPSAGDGHQLGHSQPAGPGQQPGHSQQPAYGQQPGHAQQQPGYSQQQPGYGQQQPPGYG